MIDYEKYMENEDFIEMLDYLRGNCLLDEDQMIDENKTQDKAEKKNDREM